MILVDGKKQETGPKLLLMPRGLEKDIDYWMISHLWDLNHEFSDESIMEIGFTRAAGGASFPIWWSIFGDGQAAKSQNGGTIINYHLADSLMSIYNGEIDYRMKTQN